MEFVQVGYFSKTHGVKGHLILRADQDFFIEEVKALLVESATGKAPYFISEMRENNVGLIVLLEDIDAVEKARMLIGKKVFIDPKFIAEQEEEHNWLAYELVDKVHGLLGRIREVTNNGVQLLVTIDFKGKEIMLPLVEDFIEQIDEPGKKIYYKAPEGLIELYLEDEEK